MASYTSSMTFLQFPREIRDLVYSVIVPRDETYTISCTSRIRLPQVIFRVNPDLGILWTSKAIQHEFLESLCAISTFRFSFPNAVTVMQPVSQDQANLMQRIEIDFDLMDSVSLALRVFSRDGIKRKTCRITLRNEYALGFSHAGTGFFHIMMYLNGFETVTVVQKFKWDATNALRFRWYLELNLGPSSVHHEGATKCNEFHPRKFLDKGLS